MVLALLMFSSPVYTDKKRNPWGNIVGTETFCNKLLIEAKLNELTITSQYTSKRDIEWSKRDLKMPREFKEMADKVIVFYHWCRLEIRLEMLR